MRAKRSGRWGTVASILFTSVVGPLVVQLIIPALKTETGTQAEVVVAAAPWCKEDRSPIGPEEPVIAEGEGPTPEAAWYDAVRNGLRVAVLSQLDARTRAWYGPEVSAAVLADSGGLVTRCIDLQCTGGRRTWQRRVAVFVDRAALMHRSCNYCRPDGKSCPLAP